MKRSHKPLPTLLVLLLALLSGCANEELINSPDATPPGVVPLNLHVINNSPATRADELLESTIKTLHVVEFDAATGVKTREVTALQRGANWSVELLGATKATQLLILANITAPTGLTKLQEYKDYSFTTSQCVDGSKITVADSNPTPMTSSLIDRAANLGNAPITVELTRLYAKLSVDASSVAASFTLKSIQLWSGAKQSSLLPKSTLTSHTTAGSIVKFAPIAPTVVDNNSILNEMYCFENGGKQGVTNPNFILIEGDYIALDGTRTTCFYRIDIGYPKGTGTSYDLVRNAHYQIDIQSITIVGHATREEAAAHLCTDVTYTLKSLPVSAGFDVVSSDKYYLALTNSDYTIYSDLAQSSIVVTTIQHNVPAGAGYPMGTITVLSAQPAGSLSATSTIPLSTTSLNVLVSMTKEFTRGQLLLKVGNLQKVVMVTKKAKVSFAQTLISTYSGSEYKTAEIESVNPSVRLSTDGVNVTDQKRVESNNGGGVWLHLQPLSTDKDPTTVFLSRSNGMGRSKIVLYPLLNYIIINHTMWAVGNLVATSTVSGAVDDKKDGSKVRIGCPEDGGLYFQFGSLIGMKGGAESSGGAGWGQPFKGTWTKIPTYNFLYDVMVWPSKMIGYPTTYPRSAPLNDLKSNQWYTSTEYDIPPDEPGDPNDPDNPGIDNSMEHNLVGYIPTKGVGDPCTYYLGGNWRMPYSFELIELEGYGRSGKTTVNGVSGCYIGPKASTSPDLTTDLFMPYSSAYDEAGAQGGASAHLWSKTVMRDDDDADDGSWNNTEHIDAFHMQLWDESHILTGSQRRIYGFPIRCLTYSFP